MKKAFQYLPVFLMLIIAFSCNNRSFKETSSDPSKFEKFIKGYTGGVVSSDATILIWFNQKITGYQPGTELPENILSLKPSTKGKAFLIDPQTIEFRPDQALQHGADYLALLKLHELFDVESELQDFDFSFSVIAQDFSVFPGMLSSANTQDETLKVYEGKLITADNMRPEDARKLLSASSDFGNLKVDVLAEGSREFRYTIAGIMRREEAYTISLTWNGSPVGISKKGSLDIQIPSINEFTLLQVKVDQKAANQNIRLLFSDPIDPSQNLDGLVWIKNLDDVKLTRQGSVISIFPNQRLQGQQTVFVEASLRSKADKTIGSRQSYVVAMEAMKPEVQIVGNGVVMPDSRNLVLSFKSISLKAVDVVVYKIYTNNIMQFFQENNYDGSSYLYHVGRPVYRKMVRLDENPDMDLNQWNAFSVDLAGMISHDPNAMYRVKFAFRKEYAFYNCGGEDSAVSDDMKDLALMSDDEKSFYDGNSGYYWDYPENYNWRDHDNPCTDSYYTPEKFPERNVLASNLGIIAKSSDNRNYTIAVTDLLSTAPVSAVTLEFYNYQQQKIGSANTSMEGMAEIALDDVPFILLAKKDGQQSWLRLDDGSSLSVSNFDVSGQKISKGIKGMIYGERGVWRPGDTLFLTFVMDDVGNKLSADQPVVFELFNSRGQQVVREVKTSGTNGFYTFRPVSDAEAPTGNWTARVSVGGATFDKRIKVETVKPNRLKINLDFDRKILSKDDPNQRGILQAKWLHGADASMLDAKVNVSLQNSNYTFDGFGEYSFSDASKNYYPGEFSLFDGTLDANGRASFPVDMYVNYNAPGMLRAVFNTRVFEKGGEFSTDVFSMPLAPYNTFVGVHIPDGGDYKNMLTTDTSHTIKVVTLNKAGKLVPSNNLEVKIYKISWHWWWSSSQDNLARWTHGEDADVVMQKNFSAKNGKATLSFRIDYPDWGRYFVQVIDHDGGHSTGMPVYIDWPSYISRKDRSNPAGATMLSVSTDKEKYQPGDKAKLTFPGTAQSRALISLETGSEILETFWITCNKGETIFEFDITPEMAPNVYANVTLLQPHANTINDLPIRLYGLVPIMVENPETILEPVLVVPDEIRPLSSYQVEVHEKNGKAMTYTLAVVDEGLLDLTRFETPNPWQTFYAREALGVKTWDLYDEVLGAYGGSLQKVLAIGGDQDKSAREKNKANRFKPVVEFLGPFTLQKNEKATLDLRMPNYVGSVKIMVVAGYDGAWGSADESIPVRQPIMVLPTAPRVISPLEEFDLPVAVFAMKDNIKNVDVRVETEGDLAIVGEHTRETSFEKAGEKMLRFKLAAGKTEGVATIFVKATSGRESASAQIELELSNPNPYVTRVETIVLEAGETQDISCEFFGMSGTNSGFVEISGMPSIDLERNLRYLIRYPYGCLEQITSSAFAQLYLGNLTELDDKEKQSTSNNIRKSIQKITRFQLPDGGLSYWPGRRHVSEWGSVYAGHFLLLAQEKGYLIPSGFKSNWMNYEFLQASNFVMDDENLTFGHSLTQAYRLYVLSLAGRPNLSAMNRLREDEKLSISARWRLAAAYLLAGMPEVTDELTQNQSTSKVQSYTRPGSTFGSALRDRAMILETLVLMNKDEEAFELAVKIAQQMSTGYMSTQTTAFTLYAMAKFAEASGDSPENKFLYTHLGEQHDIRTQVPVFKIEVSESENQVSIKNTGDNKLYITKTLSGKPIQGMETDEQKNLTMAVKYQSIDGSEIDISSLKQGTDFEAIVTITNPGLLGAYTNLALAQVFPSGWEILNTRYAEGQTAQSESNFDYLDIRDDRVLTFFDLHGHQSATFKVSLNASYTGKFYMPGLSCEAMYDNTIYARQKGRWVHVVK